MKSKSGLGFGQSKSVETFERIPPGREFKCVSVEEDGRHEFLDLDISYEARCRGLFAPKNAEEIFFYGFAGVPAVGTIIFAECDFEPVEGQTYRGKMIGLGKLLFPFLQLTRDNNPQV